MYLEHTKHELPSYLHTDIMMYTIIAIWIIAIIGLIAVGYVGGPTLIKEHKQEIEIDGELHVIHDKSKDEYEYSNLTSKEEIGLASRIVGWCVYLYALYWLLRLYRHLLPSNLLVLALVSVIYIVVCYFVDKYIYKIWKYVLYGCWGIVILDLLIALIIWMYNTAI
ncbi:MAG: hypothetical protein K2L11_07745 [Muribaculaceae bacterium]|nr:hypothetical protein [Muribaculaceae bacterium]